jgi:hypothetical protein
MTMRPPPSQELSTVAGGPATSRQAPLALPTTSPPNASGAWHPLLDEVLAGRARDAIEAIGRHLGEPAAPDSPGALDPSLFTGAAGVAVCLGHLARWQDADEAAASREFARAVSAAAETPQSPCFCEGLAGVGWAAMHLHALVPGLGAEAINDEIDGALLDSVGDAPWADNYELLYGLVGIGAYALERLPRPSAVACLEQVIDRLERLAERAAEEITWRVNPEFLDAETRDAYPLGCYDLGLAHGVPGATAFLGRVCEAGVAGAKARRLLEGAGRWLLGRQPGDGQGFSRYLDAGDGRPGKHRRLAWCSGDLSVAAALLVAGRCARLPAWEREALAIARRAAQLPPEQSGVRDAGLCHGAAGVGHLFNRMYQATGDPTLGEAARFWFRRTLDMRQQGRGVGGYQALRPDREGNDTWVDDRGFLMGSAGIALALLAAVAPEEPAWDRVLLISAPCTGGSTRPQALQGGP